MYPRRGYDRWFPKTGRVRKQVWRDDPQEQFQCYGPRELFCRDEPRPSWNQCRPEQQWEHSNWNQDNHYNQHFSRNVESGGNYRGSVPYRGSYWRRPQRNFHQKSHHRGHFNKGPKSSSSKGSGDFRNSSHSSNLIKTVKKDSDSVKAKAPSAAPKETKQDQTDSAALAKQSNACQIEPGTASPKAEEAHREAPCAVAGTVSSSVTLGNLRPLKEEKDIELVPLNDGQAAESPSIQSLQVLLNDGQAAEGPSIQTASLLSAEVFSDQQGPSQTTEGFHCVVKQEPELIQLKGHQTFPIAAEKQSDVSHCTTPLTPVEAPAEQQALLKTAKYVLSMEKEEPVQLQDAEDPPHQTAFLPSSEAPIEEQRPAETSEDVYSVKKEEPFLLEDRPPMHHFSSTVPTDIPLLFEATDDHQSKENEETELTQMAGGHENGDSNQTTVATASGSSDLPTATSDVHSVPVLVREKDFELAEHPRGWAPEDYQEPPQPQDKTDKCDRMPDHKRDLALYRSSSCTRVACDKKSDTRRVLEGCSCSPKRHYSGGSPKRHYSGGSPKRHYSGGSPKRHYSGGSPKRHYSSGSRHSSRNWDPRELRVQSPPRRGRSPRRHGRSPLQSPPRRGRSPPRRGRSPPKSSTRRGRSPLRSPPRRGRSPPRRGRSPLRSPLRQGSSSPRWFRHMPRRGRSPPQSPPRLDWSSPQSSPRSPPEERWSLPRSPPEERWSPLQSSPRSPPQGDWSPLQPSLKSSPQEGWSSPQSPPRQDCHSRDLWQLHRKTSHESSQEKDYPAHEMCHHRGHHPKERVPHSYSPESPTAIQTKEAQTPTSYDHVALDVEATTSPKSTENLQPMRSKESQMIQLEAGTEDSDFPWQYAIDETGSSAPSWTSNDRSAAVLARKEEIEQAFQQVLLNFAAVATILLETQPCMTERMEAALQATVRKFGNYYECKLKDFIEHFDLAADS